jgi:(2Fe-2S) ferredoxin
MMKRNETPYKCHLFICIKTRDGIRKSCGDGGSLDLQGALKDAVRERGWKGTVRVSTSGCLGQCETGPNIMIYPQKIWFSEVTHDDVPEILQTLARLVGE